MTRVNAGVPPTELSNLHLGAEIRELPRCFTYAVKYRHQQATWPTQFTLNKGHVKWCANNTAALQARLRWLGWEARRRGLDGWANFAFRVLANLALACQHSPDIKQAMHNYTGQYNPAIVRQRIQERLNK